MTFQHRQLALGAWDKLSLTEQLANVGSEVERTISWRKKNNLSYSQKAFERALELLSLTIASSSNTSRLKELTRLYELLADYFVGENKYGSSNELWQKYFFAFAYKLRRTR